MSRIFECHRRYHEMKLVCITPDKKLDYLVEMVLEGLSLLNDKLTCSATGNGMSGVDDETFINEAKTADAVLCFWGKIRNNQPQKRYLLEQILTKPVIYIDGSEWTCSGYRNQNQEIRALSNPYSYREEPWIDVEMLSCSNFYLKRECYDIDVRNGIIPFPFASMDRHTSLTTSKKDIDILCCFGQDMTGLRKQVTEVLQSLKINLKIVTGKLPEKEYRKLLGRSRYVIDAWGGGNTCDRFFEIIGADALPISQQPLVVIPNQYSDYTNILFFNTIKEFVYKINHLPDEEVRLKMLDACKHHTMTYHSSIVRAKQIHSIIESYKNVR